MDAMKNKKKIIKIALQVIIYSLVAYYIFSKLAGNWEVFDKMESFSFPLLLLSIFIFSLHAIWNAFVWHYMINSKRYNLSLMGQVDVYLRSYLLRYIPGNVVGILSRAIFNKVYGVPILKSLFAWCYENLLYLVIGAVLGSFIVIRAGEGWPIFNSIPAVPFFIIVILTGTFIVLRIDWFEKIFRKFIIPRLPERIRKETDLLNLPLMKRINLFMGFGVSWVIYSVSFIVLVWAIDPSILHTNILELVSINALSWVLGYLSFVTPSGSGVREWAMIFSMENFMGINVETALIITLLARIVFIFGELFGFGMFFSFKYLHKYVTKQNEI
jgi:glycosyltransferase 2 family protein